MLSALLFLFGCDMPFESDDYRDRLAGIYEVAAPATVNVGSRFDVVMLSIGANGCWRPGRNVVRQIGALAVTITPYVQEYTGDGACTANTPTLTHSVRLLAESAGNFEVSVKTALPAGVIERTVVVR